MMANPDLETIVDAIHQVLKYDLLPVGEDFAFDTNLFDVGLDSMAIAQLLLEIQSRWGIWVGEEHLTPQNLRSCRALAACVHRLIAEKAPGE
jgi:acyl carrier protein